MSPSRRDEGKAVQGQIHLDDVDGFFARDRLGDEDVDLALDVVVHDQFLAGQIFVKMQHVEHVAVRILHRHHVDRRDWSCRVAPAGPRRRAGRGASARSPGRRPRRSKQSDGRRQQKRRRSTRLCNCLPGAGQPVSREEKTRRGGRSAECSVHAEHSPFPFSCISLGMILAGVAVAAADRAGGDSRRRSTPRWRPGIAATSTASWTATRVRRRRRLSPATK